MGEIITPESLRISAVGRDLPEEELNLFHAGFEEERMILAEQDTLAEGGVKFASKLIDAGVTVYAKRVKGSSHGFTVRRKDNYPLAEKIIFEALDKVKNTAFSFLV